MRFNSPYKKSLLDTFWLAFHRGQTKAQIDNELQYAAMVGNLWRADYLLRAKGADVTSSEQFCIRWAANGGKKEMVEFLLAQGADVNARQGEPLVRAVERGYTEIALLLLDRGAQVSLRKARALNLAHEAHNTVLLKRMLETKEDLTEPVAKLLKIARENQTMDLVGVYEAYLKIDPPQPQKPGWPKIK